MAGLIRKPLVAMIGVLIWVAVPRPAAAYSVLAHEAMVDMAWSQAIRPLLKARFPRTTDDQLMAARAYAYGGSVIQDLGYYPFGSHFFSNLLHYVRTGDFVEALIAEARDVDEYAFALGALAHYAADNTGHPEAVNRAVALLFPKMRAKFGDEVTYADSPKRHVIVEFSFDVVESARGEYLPPAYHDFIGFRVATPVMERAFEATYALDMNEIFADQSRAIETYRHAIGELVPEITRVAAKDHADRIYQLTQQEYDRDFGTRYQKPGFMTRLLTWLYRLLPKIGPLAPLRFETPTPEAERLFVESLRDTRGRYERELAAVRAGRLDLVNSNFDTGKRTRHGDYRLADDTYRQLLERLDRARFAGVSGALRRDILTFYAQSSGPSGSGSNATRKDQKIRKSLTRLSASVE